jgi:hypothetical protein
MSLSMNPTEQELIQRATRAFERRCIRNGLIYCDPSDITVHRGRIELWTSTRRLAAYEWSGSRLKPVEFAIN